MIYPRLRFLITCLALPLLANFSLCITVHAHNPEELFALHFELQKECWACALLKECDIKACFEEDKETITQHFRNDLDQGKLCSDALQLLQNAYAALAQINSDSTEFMARNKITMIAGKLRFVIASLIEDLDQIGRLRFYSTLLATTEYSSYHSDRATWLRTIYASQRFLFDSNDRVVTTGIDTLVTNLRNLSLSCLEIVSQFGREVNCTIES